MSGKNVNREFGRKGSRRSVELSQYAFRCAWHKGVEHHAQDINEVYSIKQNLGTSLRVAREKGIVQRIFLKVLVTAGRKSHCGCKTTAKFSVIHLFAVLFEASVDISHKIDV